ncbi:hypothetical protein SCA6_000237 [Theobroma cacao]
MFVFWNQCLRFLRTKFGNFPSASKRKNFSSSLLSIGHIIPVVQVFLALLWVLFHLTDDQTATSSVNVLSVPKACNSCSPGVSPFGRKEIGTLFVIIMLGHWLAIFLHFRGINFGFIPSTFKRKNSLYLPLSITLVPIFLSPLLVLFGLTNDQTATFSGCFLSPFKDCESPFVSLFCTRATKILTFVLWILALQINDTDHRLFQLLLTFCLSRDNFSQLPDDVISKISNRFTSFEDLVALSGVCRSLRFACSDIRCAPRHRFPRLMLCDKENRSTKSFYSVGRNKIYELELPQAHGKRCHGSPYGWIVTMGPDLQAHLLHPLSQAQLSLPKLNTIRSPIGVLVPVDPFRFIRKCILLKTSPSHSQDEFLVMVIFGPKHSLAFAKPGSVGWTTIVGADGFKDILLFKGQIHAICGKGTLLRFRSDDPEATPRLIAYHPEDVSRVERIYLLESSGELLGVFRFSSSTPFVQRYDTKRFLVYVLNPDNDGNLGTWQRLNHLRDWALFVGEGNSWSVCTANIPNCRSNCIYFTDDNWDQQVGGEEQTLVGHDIGVFDMVSKKIERLELGPHSPCYQSRSVWFTPSLLPYKNYQARGVLPRMNRETWKLWPAKQNMRH